MESPELRHLAWYRALLIIVAVVLVALGFMPHETPRFDPFVARLVIAGFALLGLVLSYWVEPVRRGLRAWLMACGYGMLVWFLYTGSVNGLRVENAVSLVPMVILVAALAHSVWDIIGIAVFFVIGATLAYADVPDPALPLPVLLILQGAVIVGLGGMSLSRSRLEHELAHANEHLEQRVQERTAELAAANERLREEIQVRIQAEAVAKEASQAKSLFLANMSHELRTPLTAILGYADLLAEDLEGQALADLERIQSSAKHLLTIIQDVLDLARIESKQLELANDVLVLDEVVEEAVELTRPQIEANGNRVVRECAPDLRVRGDRLRLRQVFVNLLSNAAKFTRDGEVRVWCEQTDEKVRIHVQDTGIGMSPEVASRVFERFAQGDESPTRQYGGTGLGLAISKELVEAMQGALTVESELGVGTTFTVELRVLDEGGMAERAG